MIATVTKRFVNAKTTVGSVTLFEGTELNLVPATPPLTGYEADIVSGQQHTVGTILLTEQQAANWLVFRTRKDLGYA